MLSKLKQWLFPSPEELELRKQELQRRIDERKGKSQPEPVIRVSFPSKRPGPLPPITLSSPACPYCGVIQEPPPARRRKCRDCGQTIHVRTDREERKKYLLTAEEDARLARERRNEEWKRLSELVRVAMQAGDWKSLQSAYQQQANILFVEGRPHLHVAQEASIRPIWHCQLVREPRQDATLGIDEGLWDVRWSWCRRSTESGWQHRKRDGSGR